MEETKRLDAYSEHELRHLIEGGDSNIMSSYYEDKNYWEVFIDQGRYMFSGQISQKGIPTEGAIIHDNEEVRFLNNQQLLNNNFKDTIIGLFQKKINENLQHAYEEEEEEDEWQYNRFEVNRRSKRQRNTTEYQNAFGGIQEQEHESDSDEEGNVIHENTINENPTRLTQQHQTQPNLSLQSGQNQGFGLGGDN